MVLDGRVAIVTGAGSGIGRATALALARAGAHVAAVDVDAELAKSTADAVEALGRQGLALDSNGHQSTLSTALPGKRRASRSCATCAISVHGRSTLMCGASCPEATSSASRRSPTDAGSCTNSVKR